MDLITTIASLTADRATVMAALGKAQAAGDKAKAQALYEAAIEMGGLIKKLQALGE